MVDGDSLDILHDQIRQTFFGAASIEEFDDVGMVQCCQCLAFVAEAAKDVILASTGFDHLDGHALAVLAISSLRQIDHRHTAVPTLADNSVSTDLLSHHGVTGKGRNLTGGRLFQERIVVMQEQGLNFRIKRLVIPARLPKESLALTRALFQGRAEEIIDLLPLLRHHSGCVPVHAPATPWQRSNSA